MLNNRSESILETLVEEYIRLSKPISSEFLAKSGRFDFSPATMRNEFVKLTHEGFIKQPHTSAGRIPTNKGYRYYVDRLMELEELDRGVERMLYKIFEDHYKNVAVFHNALTQYIAGMTENLAFSELLELAQNTTYGFENLARQPEFEDPKAFRQLARVIDKLEQDWETVAELCPHISHEAVIIGDENDVFEQNISSVMRQYRIGPNKTLLLGVIGPNRMKYSFTLGIFKKINELVDEYYGASR